MIYEYKPSGVCSRKYTFDIENNVIKSLSVEGGCAGNLAGISSIIRNMKAEDVIKAFEGIKCGFRSTSCPDQLAQALKAGLN